MRQAAELARSGFGARETLQMLLEPFNGFHFLPFSPPLQNELKYQPAENQHSQKYSNNEAPHGHGIVRKGRLKISNRLFYVAQIH